MVPLEEAARIVSTSLQTMGNSIASRGCARLMSDMQIGKLGCVRPSNNQIGGNYPGFQIHKAHIIQTISDQDIQ